MSRILIPRGPCCSSKTVASTDWCLYFAGVIQDHVVCGLVVTGVACMRDLSIASGNIRIQGLSLQNTTADTSITCLGACDTHHIYATVNKDGMCRPCNYTFTSNTTGCLPANSTKIASVVVGACCVTSVCQKVPCNIERRAGNQDPTFFGEGTCGDVTICGCTDLGACSVVVYSVLEFL